ncbi:hypothetical protein [Nonomuraea sp. NPDC050783]|uniref:hypothetical protein n=1 Tax=Nonomuraea sp. NPDC050783 TaxID=3154634 RepID=UPI0034666E01
MTIMRCFVVVAVCLWTTGCVAETTHTRTPTTPATRSPGLMPSAPIKDAARWKHIKVPPLGETTLALTDVVATGAGDAWAVGAEDDREDGDGFPLLLRWDGSRWARSRLPWQPNYLDAIDTDGPDDIWLAGGEEVARRHDGRWTVRRPFGDFDDHGIHFRGISADKGRAVVIDSERHIVQWNGKRFSTHRVGDGDVLNGVSLVRGRAWIVGAKGRAGCQGTTPKILRLTPEGELQDMPVPDVPGGALNSVRQVAPNDVWAVGTISTKGDQASPCPGTVTAPPVDAARPLVMHWDGVTWKHVLLPAWSLSLTKVTATERNEVWASGTDPRHEEVVAFLRYDGATWSREDTHPGGTDNVVSVSDIPGTSELWAVGTVRASSDNPGAFILRRR